jgi:hypothetical protein
MFRTTRSIFKFLIVSGLAFQLAACASMNEEKPNTIKGPVSRVVRGNYDEVWRAVQKSLAGYPIQVNNIDQGLIETDAVKVGQLWLPPFEKSPKAPNVKYSLQVRVIKGQSQNQESAQVSVRKRLSLQRDFFSNEEDVGSDGLEEKALLYRIEREMQIERSIKKAFEKGKS